MNGELELFEKAPWAVRLRVPESLGLWWEHDWSHTKKASTTRVCLRRICQFWEARFQDEMIPADMVLLRRHLAQLGLKENTINTYHTMVTRWINWLCECKEAGKAAGLDWRPISLPAKNIGSETPKVDESRFKKNVAWSKSVVFKLLAAAQRMGDQEMADVIEFLYLTELRQTDVWLLTDANVDLAHRIVFGVQNKSITRSMPSGIPFTKPITGRIETILRRRMAMRLTGQPLFRDPGFDRIDSWQGQMNRRFRVLRAFAGLPHVNLSDFRPSSATLKLDNGVDPLTVSQGLGHTTLRMLPVYARRTMVHQRAAQEKVEDAESEILK